MHVYPQADFRSGNRYPLPLGSDPTGSWECNEKRVAEEYATTSMSIVMPTKARSMTQFGLLMIFGPTSNANAIVVVSRQGEHAHK